MGFATGNAPGFTAARETDECQIWAAGKGGWTGVVEAKVQIKSTQTDSGNSPTTTLRGGIILATKTSDGLQYVYDGHANDGTQLPVAVLDHYQDMLVNGVATDRFTMAIRRAALLKEGEVLGEDAHALAVLLRSGSMLDSLTPHGGLFQNRYRKRQLKAADYTVTAADNGDLFVATTGAVVFTLPTKALGLCFEFFNTVDANMSIISAGSADDIIADGDAGADTVAFSTASHKIGSHARMTCISIATAGTLAWMFENLGGTAATIS